MSIGMVGLDTPKASRRVLRSYNLSSGSGRSVFENEPPSPTDSLNTLIERTLGAQITHLSSPIKTTPRSVNDDGDDFLPPSDTDFGNFEEILAKLSMTPSKPSSPIDTDVFNDIQRGIKKYVQENGPPAEVERADVFTALLIDFNRTSHKLISNLFQFQVRILLRSNFLALLYNLADQFLLSNLSFIFIFIKLERNQLWTKCVGKN